MELKKQKIGDLKIATYNPRKELNEKDKEYQKIKNSIIEFGYVAPIIINADKTVISGHQRIKVLKNLGYEEIDCIVVNFDKNKEKFFASFADFISEKLFFSRNFPFAYCHKKSLDKFFKSESIHILRKWPKRKKLYFYARGTCAVRLWAKPCSSMP